jgi:hypothetical protein
MPVGQTTNNTLEQPRKKTLEEQIASISAEAKKSATRAVQLPELSHPEAGQEEENKKKRNNKKQQRNNNKKKKQNNKNRTPVKQWHLESSLNHRQHRILTL